jgi:hypothetical protein
VVEAERLAGVDIASLSVEDLQTDVGATKLQAKKIVNRIAQMRTERESKGRDKQEVLVYL